MTDLPQAAQAVLKAVQATLPDYMLTDKTAGCFAAAALEAVVDQMVPIPKLPYNSCCDIYVSAIRAELLAIATELEGAN